MLRKLGDLHLHLQRRDSLSLQCMRSSAIDCFHGEMYSLPLPIVILRAK